MTLAIDLFCGLGGWTEGLLAEGYDVVGFDIERHQYGEHRYPAQLVLQDVLTLRGSQFKEATLIVASPPCQEYSYMAMPWKIAKAKAAAIRADTSGQMLADLTALFDACFRIQAEASLAAGHRIPLVVENVRGAIPWVGRSRWNFGSYHLWGDVPALMPWVSPRATMKAAFSHQPGGITIWQAYQERQGRKIAGQDWNRYAQTGEVSPHWRMQGLKTAGPPHIRDGEPHTRHLTNPAEHIKCGGDWFNAEQPSISRLTSSRSPKRKEASAMIAKIPLPLSRHIAAMYHG